MIKHSLIFLLLISFSCCNPTNNHKNTSLELSPKELFPIPVFSDIDPNCYFIGFKYTIKDTVQYAIIRNENLFHYFRDQYQMNLSSYIDEIYWNYKHYDSQIPFDNDLFKHYAAIKIDNTLLLQLRNKTNDIIIEEYFNEYGTFPQSIKDETKHAVIYRLYELHHPCFVSSESGNIFNSCDFSFRSQVNYSSEKDWVNIKCN